MEIKLTTTPQFHHCERGWRWSPPPLPDFDLWWVMDGVGNINLDGRDYPVGAGTVLVFRPGSRVIGTQNPQRRLAVFAAHFELRGARRAPLDLPVPMKIRDLPWFGALARRCVDGYQRPGTLGREQARLCVHQMLLQLLEEASRPAPSPTDTRLLEVVVAIQRRPGAMWYVDQMALAAHLTRAQFVRRFEQVTGVSPSRFVIRTRMEC